MVDPKRKKSSKDDDEDDTDESLSSVSVESLYTLFDIAIYRSISSNIEDHKDLINVLRKAKDGDLVKLRLSSHGGSIQSGYIILNAIKQCRGHVHAEIEAPCYSMASVIALACDSIKFHIGTYLMFHNYSGGFFGKGSEMKDQIENYSKINKDMDNYYCAPFLTKKEIEKLASDSDLYIHWDDKDLKDRIKRHFKQHEVIKGVK